MDPMQQAMLQAQDPQAATQQQMANYRAPQLQQKMQQPQGYGLQQMMQMMQQNQGQGYQGSQGLQSAEESGMVV